MFDWLSSPTEEQRLAREVLSEEMEVRERAAHALAEQKTEAAAEALLAGLAVNVGEWSVRAWIPPALLLAIGSPAARPLLKALREGNSNVRLWAAEVLGKLRVVEAAPLLAAALSDEDLVLRKAAADALGQIGPAAAPAAAALAQNLEFSVASVHEHVVAALVKIGPKVTPAVLAVLPDPRLRLLAVEVLDGVRHVDAALLPTLVEMWNATKPVDRTPALLRYLVRHSPATSGKYLNDALRTGTLQAAEAARLLHRLRPKEEQPPPALAEAVQAGIAGFMKMIEYGAKQGHVPIAPERYEIGLVQFGAWARPMIRDLENLARRCQNQGSPVWIRAIIAGLSESPTPQLNRLLEIMDAADKLKSRGPEGERTFEPYWRSDSEAGQAHLALKLLLTQHRRLLPALAATGNPRARYYEELLKK